MFDLIDGIPVHAFVVHAVVVLLPLAVVGTIVVASVPRWRGSCGPLVVAAALVATVLTQLATSSGKDLEKPVGDVGEHAELGDRLIWFAIPLLVLVTSLGAAAAQQQPGDPQRRRADRPRAGPERPGKSLLMVIGVLAVVAARASAVQVYRVGDSGAKAVWGDQVNSSAPRT